VSTLESDSDPFSRELQNIEAKHLSPTETAEQQMLLIVRDYMKALYKQSGNCPVCHKAA